MMAKSGDARDYRLLVHSARQVVQMAAHGETSLSGRNAMNDIAVLNRRDDAIGLSIVVDRRGLVEAIGFDDTIRRQYESSSFERVIDASDKCIVPGLVDAHTHAMWAGDRVHEFALKLAGASYLDVHRAGGGIHDTVRHVRAATRDELSRQLQTHAERMLHAGTTLFECKSGYGLRADAELKMLEAMEDARGQMMADMSVTYCAAHAVPIDVSAEQAVDDIINVQLPDVRRRMDAGQLNIDSIDVFCETAVFDVDQARRILLAGRQLAGLAGNFHAEELHCLHSAEMGCQVGARAMSHLEQISEQGIAAMATSKCVAILLPTTAYMLRLKPPPGRRLVDYGVVVALGSDFNPNAHCLAMPLVMHLACVTLHMTMTEALAAATINAAAAVGKSHTHGSLEVGKLGDMLIIDAPTWEHLIYQFGSYQHIISHVVKAGRVVHSNTRPC